MTRAAKGWPVRPAIAEALLRRHDGPLEGPIRVGEVFAWQPDCPHARELVIVQRIEETSGGRMIWSCDLEYGQPAFNDEGRFRAAVQRTVLASLPPEPGPLRAPVPPALVHALAARR